MDERYSMQGQNKFVVIMEEDPKVLYIERVYGASRKDDGLPARLAGGWLCCLY